MLKRGNFVNDNSGLPLSRQALCNNFDLIISTHEVTLFVIFILYLSSFCAQRKLLEKGGLL